MSRFSEIGHLNAELVSGTQVAQCECTDSETQQESLLGLDVFSLQLQGPSLVQHSHLKPGRHRPYSAQPPHHLGLLPFTAQFCVYFQVLSRPEVLTHFYKPGGRGERRAVRGGGRKGVKEGKSTDVY